MISAVSQDWTNSLRQLLTPLGPAVSHVDYAVKETAKRYPVHRGDNAEGSTNDMDESFPQAAIDSLSELQIHRLYIPHQDGGELVSLHQLVVLWRLLARQDLTLAVAHGKTFLGSICVWIAGSKAQKATVAEWIDSHHSISWGLTERDHGADLLASETSAIRTASGWQLSGEKWLINNANRSRAITVLARTDDQHGARNLSLFLVDKQSLQSGQYLHLDKILTQGVRGADISGIAFDKAELQGEALIGEPGSGLEITLKALQLTRIACCGLSLGSLEGALLTCVRFARKHRLYGRALLALDSVQETLLESLVTFWFSEVTLYMAAGVADILPEELAIVSTLSKSAIPARVAVQLAALEEQMGARGFVTDLPDAENFEKRIRDHQIVPIFDGSTLVCRISLVPHLASLIRHYRKGSVDKAGLEYLGKRAFSSSGIQFERLALTSRTGCSLIQAIPSLINKLLAGSLKVEHKNELHIFLVETEKLIDRLEKVPVQLPDVPMQTLMAIEAYEWLFIGACCLHFWSGRTEDSLSDSAMPDWLVLCINRINRELRRERAGDHLPCAERDILKPQLFKNFERLLGLPMRACVQEISDE
jgi:alkylation response protein AidB-like acyl-CoA dehydrogenase